MTDFLQSYDYESELLKKYDEELQELETLPLAAIELPPLQALALVTHIQIAATNPAVRYNPLLPSAIAAAKHIQESFNQESAIFEVLELGWADPPTGPSVPPQILTSTPCRQKKLRRPPPDYDDNHHDF